MRFKRLVPWLMVAAFFATVIGVSLEGAWAQEEPAISISVRSGDPTLLAKGAAVQVPIIYSCTVAEGVTVTGGHVSVGVRQVVKKAILSGGNSVSLAPVCDGVEHTVTVTVYGHIPFSKGLAVVEAFVGISGRDASGGEYGGFVFADASSTAEARIR